MPSTNVKTIRQRVAEKAFAGRYTPIVSTATGGAVGTVVDSAYAIPGATADHFDFKIIKIATDAGGAGAAPEGEVRYISEGGYTAATGTFATEVDFTAAVASGDTYEIHEIDPGEIDKIIKRKVRDLYMPSLWPLSLLIVQNDANDMEPSTIATDYDISVGASTLATETTIVRNGAQSLKSTNTVANEYFALKALLGVNEGQTLVAAASCYVTSGDDAIFRVWDTTNAAAIDSATSDEVKWMDLIVPFSVPTGCERVDLRMMGVGSDDVIYWDDIQVWAQNRQVYPLPSWVTRKEQIEGVIAFPQGTAGPGTLQYRPDEWSSYKLSWGVERADIRADNELFIWVDSPGYSRPYVIARRTLPEPTSDTSAIFFEPDLLVEGVLAEVYPILARMSTGEDATRYLRDAREADTNWQAGLRSLGLLDPIERKQSNRIYVR